jgi:hypothetical protein
MPEEMTVEKMMEVGMMGALRMRTRAREMKPAMKAEMKISVLRIHIALKHFTTSELGSAEMPPGETRKTSTAWPRWPTTERGH